jgi:Helix-turn-helix domain
MALPTGMTRALARSPGLFVSTMLTCMVGVLLPPPAGSALFFGGLALMGVLCAGALEGPAVRLLGRARVLSEAEAAALAPAIALLCQKGLDLPAAELFTLDSELGISTGAAGRRSVVVSAGLLRAVHLGHLPADQAAGVIATAVGRIRLGQTRFDVAVEFWTLPWYLLRSVWLAIAKTIALLPLTQLAWRIRFVMTSVAVVQSFTEGRIASGVVVAVFIALTYLTPRWQREWDTRSQEDSDRFVADHELGDALGRFLRRCPPEPRTLERIHRLSGPFVRPSLALVVKEPLAWGDHFLKNGVMSYPSRPVLEVLPQVRGTASVRQTPAQRRRLIDFVALEYQRGSSLRQLGEQTGRTQAAVQRALDQAGVARRGRGAPRINST